MSYKNAIVRLEWMPASQFVFNPLNPRIHPEPQRKAVQASLNEFGWVSTVMVNEQTGYVVDGHERIWDALAISDDEPVPALIINCPSEKEPALLAVFDKITTMATYDPNLVNTLLESAISEDTILQGLLNQMKEDAEIALSEPNWGEMFSQLPDNNHGFRQVTFTLHESQFEIVERALKIASRSVKTTVNENSNGNAIAVICERFLNANS